MQCIAGTRLLESYEFQSKLLKFASLYEFFVANKSEYLNLK